VAAPTSSLHMHVNASNPERAQSHASQDQESPESSLTQGTAKVPDDQFLGMASPLSVICEGVSSRL